MSDSVSAISAYQAQTYAKKLHSAGSSDVTFNSMLNDDNLSCDDWTKIIKSYNEDHGSLANRMDSKFKDAKKEELSDAVVSKLLEAAKGGNQDALDILCQELYNSTAGKLGTSDEYVKSIINQADKETLAKIMDNYKTATGSEIYKDIQNDFSGKDEEDIIAALDSAYYSTKGSDYTGWDDGKLTHAQIGKAAVEGVKDEAVGLGVIAGVTVAAHIPAVAGAAASAGAAIAATGAVGAAVVAAAPVVLAVAGVVAAGFLIFKGVKKIANAIDEGKNATCDQQAMNAVEQGVSGGIEVIEGAYMGYESAKSLVNQAKSYKAEKSSKTPKSSSTTETTESSSAAEAQAEADAAKSEAKAARKAADAEAKATRDITKAEQAEARAKRTMETRAGNSEKRLARAETVRDARIERINKNLKAGKITESEANAQMLEAQAKYTQTRADILKANETATTRYAEAQKATQAAKAGNSPTEGASAATGTEPAVSTAEPTAPAPTEGATGGAAAPSTEPPAAGAQPAAAGENGNFWNEFKVNGEKVTMNGEQPAAAPKPPTAEATGTSVVAEESAQTGAGTAQPVEAPKPVAEGATAPEPPTTAEPAAVETLSKTQQDAIKMAQMYSADKGASVTTFEGTSVPKEITGVSRQGTSYTLKFNEAGQVIEYNGRAITATSTEAAMQSIDIEASTAASTAERDLEVIKYFRDAAKNPDLYMTDIAPVSTESAATVETAATPAATVETTAAPAAAPTAGAEAVPAGASTAAQGTSNTFGTRLISGAGRARSAITSGATTAAETGSRLGRAALRHTANGLSNARDFFLSKL